MSEHRPILIYDRVANDHIPRWLSGLVCYLKTLGHPVHTMSGRCSRDLSEYCHIFMWNGNLPIHKPIQDQARAKSIPITYAEVGFFPQSQYYVLDAKGINAKSSLITDDLTWVTDHHLARLVEFSTKYLKGKTWKGSGRYVLCPLQLEDDTNIIEHSPIRHMQQFVEHVERTFPNEEIVFKTHPLAANKRVRTKHTIKTNGDFKELAQNAKLVYGINSTCLLESAMMGVPTKAIGDGYVKAHQHQLNKLLAALVDRQIPVNRVDLDYWVRPMLERCA